MLKHLISLVFLFASLTFVKANYSDKTVILPKPKPQKILNQQKKKFRNILPLKKPGLKKINFKTKINFTRRKTF